MVGRVGWWPLRIPQRPAIVVSLGSWTTAPQQGEPFLRPNPTFPSHGERVYRQLRALCDCTHLTLVFERRFCKSREKPGEEVACARFQWSRMGQAAISSPRLSQTVAAGEPPAQRGPSQIKAWGQHSLAPKGAQGNTLPCGHTSLFPSECSSALYLRMSLPVAKHDASLQILPSCREQPGAGEWLVRKNPGQGYDRQWLGDLGEAGKVLQEGTSEARGMGTRTFGRVKL